ncbi:MAG: polymerase subunit alpha, partial [Verrucomicrobiota bacterium]
HPCGLVLSRQPMDQVVPRFISAKGYPTTHFDMDSVEAVGLVKMDILAQGGLAVMRDVKEMLAQNPKSECRNPKEARNSNVETRNPVADSERLPALPSDFEFRNSFGFRHSDFRVSFSLPPDLDALEPWTDPAVWEMIANGHARAVHHIESPAMISLCKMCDVRDIDTLIAIVSVIRPGAANESKKMEFARRYQGLSPVRYPHPSLERCLRSTYGLVVYEEHILQICEAFAGLPPGRADILRRALGKDKTEVINQIKTEFANCARKLGRAEIEIAEVWDLVVGFKGYAFCKAHSTAYGVEAYQSAWLKLNHPAEFMAAVLTNGKGFYDPLVYVLECHRLGIPLLPPSVNEPGPQFTVTGAERPNDKIRNPKSEIRRNSEYRNPKRTAPPREFPASEFELRPSAFGLCIRVPVLNVKGLTTRTKDTILREHARGQFASLSDFLLRVQPLNEEMQSLIQAGAFDDFGKTRTTQYWEFKQRSQEAEIRSSKFDVRCSMFDVPPPTLYQLPLFPPENLDRLPSVPLAEPDRLQRLRWEEELLGYPASGHPLELYPDIAWETYCAINRLGDHIGEQIVTCGLVIEQRLFHQVTGEPMKFLTIADWTGVVETELFARTYKSYGLTTIRYRVLEITATVEAFENGRGFTLRVLRAGKPRTSRTSKEKAHSKPSAPFPTTQPFPQH